MRLNSLETIRDIFKKQNFIDLGSKVIIFWSDIFSWLEGAGEDVNSRIRNAQEEFSQLWRYAGDKEDKDSY